MTFPDAKKLSAVALQKGNDDLVKLINDVIDENTKNGNFENGWMSIARSLLKKQNDKNGKALLGGVFLYM